MHCNPITHFDAFGLKDSEGKGGFFSSIVSGVKNVGGAVVSGTKAVGDALSSSAKKIGGAAADGAKAAGGAVVAGAVGVGNAVSSTAEIGGKVIASGVKVTSRAVGRVNILGNAADNMRDAMVAQSRLDPLGRNESGVSVGFRGDGFKLGGGRFNAANPSFESPLGGIQGGHGEIFGIDYQPGSFADRLVESYAGPHDYLNSGFSYDQDGNIRPKSFLGNIMSQAMNYANVAVATPFVAASVILPTNDNPWF